MKWLLFLFLSSVLYCLSRNWTYMNWIYSDLMNFVSCCRVHILEILVFNTKKFRGHLHTAPRNMQFIFEICTFSRFGAISIAGRLHTDGWTDIERKHYICHSLDSDNNNNNNNNNNVLTVMIMLMMLMQRSQESVRGWREGSCVHLERFWPARSKCSWSLGQRWRWWQLCHVSCQILVLWAASSLP